MNSVIDYTDVKYVKELTSTNKFDIIEELATVFKDSSSCSNVEDLISALKEREEIMSTGIGFGIAIPHAKINKVNEMTFAIGISKEGVNFDSMDGKPVHLIILVAAGEKQHREYLKLLSNIMSILKNDKVKEDIINSTSPEKVLEILKENSK